LVGLGSGDLDDFLKRTVGCERRSGDLWPAGHFRIDEGADPRRRCSDLFEQRGDNPAVITGVRLDERRQQV
jgi:hypothetical protein